MNPRTLEGSQIYPEPRKSDLSARSDPSQRPTAAKHGTKGENRDRKKKACASFSHISPLMTFMPLGMMRASMKSPVDLLRKLMQDSDEEVA